MGTHELNEDERHDRRHNVAAGIAVGLLALGGFGITVAYDIGHEDGILTHRATAAAGGLLSDIRTGIHDAAVWVADHTED